VLLAISWLLMVPWSTLTLSITAGIDEPLLLDAPLDPELLELAPLELAPELDAPELLAPPELVDPPPLLVLPLLAVLPEDEEPLVEPFDPCPPPPVVPPLVVPPGSGCHEPVGRPSLPPQARLRATSGRVRRTSERMVTHPCNWGTNVSRPEKREFS
jgi:hypothetical protein